VSFTYCGIEPATMATANSGPPAVLRNSSGMLAAEPAKAPRNPLRVNRFIGLRSPENSTAVLRKS
jgi:hypothetical protein